MMLRGRREEVKPAVHHAATASAAPGGEAAPGTTHPAAAKPKTPKVPPAEQPAALGVNLVPSLRQLQGVGVLPNELVRDERFWVSRVVCG